MVLLTHLILPGLLFWAFLYWFFGREAAKAGDWLDVPDECAEAWEAVFSASQEVPRLSLPCPVCGATLLRRYYHLRRRENGPTDHRDMAGGTYYVGRGFLWEWCSGCHRYTHDEDVRVPVWGVCYFKVLDIKLAAHPGPLESALHREGIPDGVADGTTWPPPPTPPR